jgi:gliding motility associated protien GldN
MKRIIGGLILMFSIAFSSEVVMSQSVVDGAYIKEHIPTKQMIKYTYLREADVMWEKRVWRRIDLREKMNFTLYYPLFPLTDRQCLFDILKKHSYDTPDMITVYKYLDEMKFFANNIIDGDQFLYPIINNSFLKGNLDGIFRIVDSSAAKLVVNFPPTADPADPTTWYDSLDVNGKPVVDTSLLKSASYEFAASDIVAWDIKEDWFFDKQRSVMDVRIIGIAPVIYKRMQANDPNSPVVGTRQLCWFYFPQIRPIIQNYFVYNRKNDAQRMSFDDLFWKRTFSSYITKESSIFDRKINDYTAGIDALLESEKIKKEMMELEHDVWEF